MVLYDFHIHSEWSDGDDSIVDIITSAKDKGMKIIGINDHFSEIKASVPQEPEGLNDYIIDIKETASEIGDGLIVLVGLEFDAFPPEDMDLKILEKFDYLLFEEFFPLPKIKKLCSLRKKIKNPEMGISHANFAWPPQVFQKVLSMLEEARIFLEFNANYTANFESILKMQNDSLLANSKVPLSIGSDSHSYKTIGSFDFAYEFAKKVCPDFEDRLILYNRYYKE
ncbi:MAG: PHP domain-containing protein [Candidatus Helarchaeales archaeon]